MENLEAVEVVRRNYRPIRIMTLFVGESAPNSGKFFYLGNTALKRHVEEAMKAAGLGGNGDFLERFKAYGWYLDDLVLRPVNQMMKRNAKQNVWAHEKASQIELRNIALLRSYRSSSVSRIL
jgi:hypothetical protein